MSDLRRAIDDVARIGLMYLEADKFEEVLLDKYGHTDYDFDKFNVVKRSLMKMERINPDLNLAAILWQLRPDNNEVAVPLVAVIALPLEGHGRTKINDEMKKVFESGESQEKKRNDMVTSYYYAVRNTDGEIVGVLELAHGLKKLRGI